VTVVERQCKWRGEKGKEVTVTFLVGERKGGGEAMQVEREKR